MSTARRALVAAAALLAVALAAGLGCHTLRKRDQPQGSPAQTEAVFQGGDERRSRVAVKLSTVATGLVQPTAAQFVPGEPETVVVLQKAGALRRVELPAGEVIDVAKLEVTSASEQGLLGLAFHPGFEKNRRFFLHLTVKAKGKDLSRVEEWKAAAPFRSGVPTRTRVVLEVEQPYANHNGGHLAFGPDGKLYVGYGDGGFKDDPHGNGQRLDTLLGKMLRLDVDGGPEGAGYAVPADNPLVKTAGARPEIWAWGLRNPWRYSFDPKGRLVVADVGQNLWEDVGFAGPGENLGWNVREGRHCFEPREGCKTEGLREPFIEHGRDEAQSVTGGVVATGKRVPALEGWYVYGDFITGRLWAARLPEEDALQPPQLEPRALGKWPVLPVHFFNDPSGDVWLLDFGGKMLRLEPG